MARYTGPKSKIARKLGAPIFGADKVLTKKNYPPGQHGQNRRRKTSEYGVQLKEKQKAKYTYGVLEKQFRNLFDKAQRSKGVTGNSLAGFNHSKYAWLEWDNSKMAGTFLHIPERADIPEEIKEQLIVELYSKN